MVVVKEASRPVQTRVAWPERLVPRAVVPLCLECWGYHKQAVILQVDEAAPTATCPQCGVAYATPQLYAEARPHGLVPVVERRVDHGLVLRTQVGSRPASMTADEVPWCLSCRQPMGRFSVAFYEDGYYRRRWHCETCGAMYGIDSGDQLSLRVQAGVSCPECHRHRGKKYPLLEFHNPQGQVWWKCSNTTWCGRCFWTLPTAKVKVLPWLARVTNGGYAAEPPTPAQRAARRKALLVDLGAVVFLTLVTAPMVFGVRWVFVQLTGGG